MNTFSFWNYLRTRIVTGEGDKILCVNTTLPPQVIGEIISAPGMDALPDGKYDLVLSESLASKSYKMGGHFKAIAERIKDSGTYAMAEDIVGAEDAWANTLLSALEPNHIRAPKVEEVVSAAEGVLELTEFLRFYSEKTFTLPKGQALDNIESQLNSLPEHIVDRLSPVFSGGRLKLNILTGLFVWQK